MLEISTASLQNGKEIRNEVREFRKDAKSYLDDEFREIRKKLTSIEDALARAGIQVSYPIRYNT
ncbi:hypothetical protein [Methanocalculus sp.]|uniref:hypothetical protein n=1 Tax=Methanocalculus sp. TaxID=2004547 RepID=UPI0026092994|nr:hypothetical protein [Methanocalculus sp.]MDG6249266.1 hypothetical protein [Methanocalculus sp.]